MVFHSLFDLCISLRFSLLAWRCSWVVFRYMLPVIISVCIRQKINGRFGFQCEVC
jgi:hypothetical protein